MAFRPQWYEQGPSPRSGWSGGLSQWSALRWILTVTLGTFGLQILAGSLAGSGPGIDPLADLLALRAWYLGGDGQAHVNLFFPIQVFSYMAVHAPSLGHVGMNMLFVWFCGRDLEAELGKSGLLRLYIAGGAMGGLAQWGFNLAQGEVGPVIGASGAVYAVLALYALRWPRRTIILFPIFIPIPVIFVLGFKVAGDLLGVLQGAAGTAFLAHLGGAAIGFLWHRRGDVLARAQAKVRQHRVEKTRQGDAEDRSEMDRILRKIQGSGLQSLDRTERAFLERRSRELRERGR